MEINMNLDLNELRERINETDKEIVDLFVRRMSISADIAEYKRQNSLPVLDASRERELLDKVASLSGDGMENYTRELYITIMKLSRDYQNAVIIGDQSSDKVE